MKPTRTEGEPHDKLTRLCAVMTAALEADPDYTDEIKCMVFLDDGKRGGLQLHNYNNDTEAMADLFVHLTAIFEANGKKMIVVPLNEG
jgi:hypothetical protein